MIILALLIKMVASSGILFGYYWLFLRNKRFHHYNRFYLLGATALSMILPFLRISVFMEPDGAAQFMYRSIEVISVNKWEHEFVENPGADQIVSWLDLQVVAVIIYTLVVTILFFLFLRALSYIRKLSKRYPVEHIQTLKFYNTTEPGTPFSFFKSIFWNKRVDFNSLEGQQIFRHELFHVGQNHSADVIFLEIIRIMLWINPFFHLIKKEIKAIHEFLADQHAVSNNNQHDYAELLLLQSITEKRSTLSTYFFQNHIKRRIAMITQFKTKKYSYWTRLMVLPLSILLFCAVALYARNGKPTNIKKELFQTVPQALQNSITILVDAGHGGEDFGSKSDNGLLEKDFTLAIARQIKQHAPAYNVKIIMTREEDTYPSIKDRAEMATTIKADMVIAVHVSAAAKIKTDAGYSPNPASGFDIFVTNKNQKTVGQSKILGREIAKQVSNIYTVNAIKQRKENGIWMLDAVPCPAVLIECGYLTNEKDVAFISKIENQEKIAKSILQGIVGYKALEENETLGGIIPGEKFAKDTLKPDQDDAGVKQGIKSAESNFEKKSQEFEKKQKLHIQKQKKFQLTQRKLLESRHEDLKKHQTMQMTKQHQLANAQEKMERVRIAELQNLQKSQLEKQHQLQLAKQNMENKRQDVLEFEKFKIAERKALISEHTKIQKAQLADLQDYQKQYHKKQQEISLMQGKMFEERIAEMNMLQREHLEKRQQIELYHKKTAEVYLRKNQAENKKIRAKPKSPKQSKPPLQPQSSQKQNPFIEQF